MELIGEALGYIIIEEVVQCGIIFLSMWKYKTALKMWLSQTLSQLPQLPNKTYISSKWNGGKYS